MDHKKKYSGDALLIHFCKDHVVSHLEYVIQICNSHPSCNIAIFYPRQANLSATAKLPSEGPRRTSMKRKVGRHRRRRTVHKKFPSPCMYCNCCNV